MTSGRAMVSGRGSEVEPEAGDPRSLVAFAVLAPSSHNTQPWRFGIDGRRIRVHADRGRALPVNDPHDRELTISCGCALMNLRVAAARAGVAVRVRLAWGGDGGVDGEGGDGPRSSGDLLATVDLGEEGSADAAVAALFPAIVDRRTHRKPMEEKAVPGEDLEALGRVVEAEGAWFEVLDRADRRLEAAALVAEGDAVQWGDVRWRRELADWMHPRRRGDGLVVPGLVAPVAQLVVRTFDLGGRVAAKDREIAAGSPVLAVLGTDGDGPGDWLRAGQALQRMLLDGHRRGLRASYLNQPIQVGSLRPRLGALVGRGGHPQILLRLGYEVGEAPATPRRGVEEVVIGSGDGRPAESMR